MQQFFFVVFQPSVFRWNRDAFVRPVYELVHIRHTAIFFLIIHLNVFVQVARTHTHTHTRSSFGLNNST